MRYFSRNYASILGGARRGARGYKDSLYHQIFPSLGTVDEIVAWFYYMTGDTQFYLLNVVKVNKSGDNLCGCI